MRFLFDGHVLDVERRELRRGATAIDLEPQVFDLLLFLLRNRDRVVGKDDLIASVWGGRIVSESTLSSRIAAVRRAIGDSGESQRLVRTVARKGLRFVGEAVESADPPAVNAPQERDDASPPRQSIRFCKTSDGVRIAWAEAGEGAPLVKAANWLNHLEEDWDGPVWSPFLHAIAARHRLIRYDGRGNGLSDRQVDDISFEGFVRDLEAVVDASRADRFDLMGASQGCAVAIAYAMRHPDRVRRLILYGGYARGRRRRNSAADIAKADAVLTLIREGWDQENPAFRQIFTSQLIPDADASQMRWFNNLQRVTVSGENAARIRLAMDDIDVTDMLPRVATPTLVLHCRDDAVQPFEEGRLLATGVANARFVALDGRNHIILRSDPQWSRFVGEIEAFLDG